MIKIKVLEARQILSVKPAKETFLQPHVCVRLFGEREEDGKEWNTSGDRRLNGLHPIWNESLRPHVVTNRDLAFLEFTLTEVSLFHLPDISKLINTLFRQTL